MPARFERACQRRELVVLSGQLGFERLERYRHAFRGRSRPGAVARFFRYRGRVKIYTKTGDDGTTGLFGGGRVRKASVRVDAYGTVDELNATLGVARATQLETSSDAILAHVQVDLFTLGAELACVPGKEGKLSMKLLAAPDAERLERAIDDAEVGLPPLKTFVLPGGSPQAAALHLARTVCRRAERVVLGIDDPPARSDVVIYLNRLSDLLFTLARKANHVAGVADVPWSPRG
jgi:cob(I)alamin adenosyltransferase